VLLVDVFRSPQIETFSLHIQGEIEEGRRRCRARVGETDLALHPLGDYPISKRSGEIEFRQRLGHGRFLLALSRDPEASVRVLNGWSIEVRSGGRVYQLLHSNQSGRLRPLGPVQTDAAFALADWPLSQPAQVDLHLMGMTRLTWSERHTNAERPTNLIWRGESGV
jgi:hypothetical protein